MKDLKARTVRGGLAKLGGQGANFLLRIAQTVVLARLLDPKDFGLVAMVTVVTGVYELFTSGGLSSATVQKASITDEQISALFWVNILIGTVLALLCLATAPVLARFYSEPRLVAVTAVMGAGFLFNAAGVQHSALLQRQLRYVTLTIIETAAQLASITVGIGMALSGFGYWSIVGSALVLPGVNSFAVWFAAAWIPRLPRRGVDILPMLRLGGTVTLSAIVMYAAYNVDKVLIGRYWGASALGLYTRAYQLINLPGSNLNAAIGGVTFSALARLQDDPVRLKSYFLKGYSLIVSTTLPITIFCALFAEDIILVLLGPKWTEAVPIFRLLTPTVLVTGLLNPLWWLILAIGQYAGSLRRALVLAPIVITAYVIGLPYGPQGVAVAFSIALVLWVIPHIVWCLHGTMISPWDLLPTVGRPLISSVVAGAVAFAVLYYFGQSLGPFVRLAMVSGVMAAAYLVMLLFVMGQKDFYLEVLRGLKASPSS